MKKILVAVDDIRSSKYVLSVLRALVRPPEEILLLHVQRLEGRSLMIDMLGEAELSTLREGLKDTYYKRVLDRKAQEMLASLKRKLENEGFTGVKSMMTDGIPAEEVLKAARTENAELIILGYGESKGFDRFVTGSVARDVEKRAKVPVLVARRSGDTERASLWKDTWYAISLATAVALFMFALGVILERIYPPYK